MEKLNTEDGQLFIKVRAPLYTFTFIHLDLSLSSLVDFARLLAC